MRMVKQIQQQSWRPPPAQVRIMLIPNDVLDAALRRDVAAAFPGANPDNSIGILAQAVGNARWLQNQLQAYSGGEYVGCVRPKMDDLWVYSGADHSRTMLVRSRVDNTLVYIARYFVGSEKARYEAFLTEYELRFASTPVGRAFYHQHLGDWIDTNELSLQQ